MSEEREVTLRRQLFRGGLLLFGFFLLWGVVWYSVRDRTVGGPEYQLQAENVEITPPPTWIRSDVKAQVLRSAGLDEGVSIFESDLLQRLHAAFPLHPWVQSVKRVSKEYPARVKVELVYRRPVCMVQVPGGVFAVDAHGVVLPSGDFRPQDAPRYPLLTGIDSVPMGEVGAAWGDERVEGGCRIAAALSDIWNPLGLEQIVAAAARSSDASAAAAQYEIYTTGGTRILWGTAPLAVDDAEATRKTVALRNYATNHGSLEAPEGPRQIDLRGEQVTTTPRTATKEDAEKLH